MPLDLRGADATIGANHKEREFVVDSQQQRLRAHRKNLLPRRCGFRRTVRRRVLHLLVDDLVQLQQASNSRQNVVTHIESASHAVDAQGLYHNLRAGTFTPGPRDLYPARYRRLYFGRSDDPRVTGPAFVASAFVTASSRNDRASTST